MKRLDQVFDGKGNVIAENEVTLTDDEVRAHRAAIYPSIGDQLDALMKEIAAAGPKTPEAQEWVTKCQAVKAKFPIV